MSSKKFEILDGMLCNGDSQFRDNLIVTGDLATGVIACADEATFNDNVTVTGDLSVDGDTSVGPLSVTGAITATGNITAFSDKKLKDNIKTLDPSKVYDMRGVSFTLGGKESSGVIAQELKEIAPELVQDNGEYLSVAYGNITGYLIEAIKTQKEMIDSLVKRVELLESN